MAAIGWQLLGLYLWLRLRVAARVRDAVDRWLRVAPGGSRAPGFRVLALYYALFSAGMALWSLPSALAGVAIESRFGFNREGALLFGRDMLLSWLVGLLTIPVLWAGYRLFNASPRKWWLWLWAVLAPLLFVQMVAGPVLIAPLFNRFMPLPPGALKQQILSLAARAGIRNPVLLVENSSSRSSHVNAYVAGWGPSVRIVIDDTALRVLPDDQILAMVGHEMGHYVEGHVWIEFVSSVLGAGLLLWIASLLLPRLEAAGRGAFGTRGLQDPAALPLILLVFACLNVVQLPIANAESRYLEHRADAFGLRLTHLNGGMARLFTGFAKRDFSDPDPPMLYQLWFGTHPTLVSRIRFAERYRPWEKATPPGTKLRAGNGSLGWNGCPRGQAARCAGSTTPARPRARARRPFRSPLL